MKAFKTIVCIILATCTFLLTGCNNWWSDADRFTDSYMRMRDAAVHVTVEEYSGASYDSLTLKRETTEWRDGENFTWKDKEGNRKLSYNGSFWIGETDYLSIGPCVRWKRPEREVETYSMSWNIPDPRNYLKEYATFARDGEYIILEQKADGGTTCSLDRQGYINAFFMTEDWEIVKVVDITITYDGMNMDADKISNIRKTVYYVETVDAAQVNEQILTQYREITQ